MCVCINVCVKDREREGGKKGGRERERKKHEPDQEKNHSSTAFRKAFGMGFQFAAALEGLGGGNESAQKSAHLLQTSPREKHPTRDARISCLSCL